MHGFQTNHLSECPVLTGALLSGSLSYVRQAFYVQKKRQRSTVYRGVRHGLYHLATADETPPPGLSCWRMRSPMKPGNEMTIGGGGKIALRPRVHRTHRHLHRSRRESQLQIRDTKVRNEASHIQHVESPSLSRHCCLSSRHIRWPEHPRVQHRSNSMTSG